MKPKHLGALPYQDIRRLIEFGHIRKVDAESKTVQPASLDLTITDQIYELDGVTMPQIHESMSDFRGSLGAKPFSITQPLEIGRAYLIELHERLDLPDSIYGYANPKSSIGRVDCHIRLVCRGFPAFDGVYPGYKGALWAIIVPKSFRLKLERGMSLNQMRFFSGDTRFTQEDLEREYRKNPLVWDKTMGFPAQVDRVCSPSRNGTVVLHADISSEVVGWCAKATQEVLDLSRRDVEPEPFWETARPKDGRLFLKKDQFWILSTEPVAVPPWLSAEVVAVDERLMEGRTHYAGFLDPGWGWRPGESMGDTVTMEVRASEDMFLRNGQPFAGVRFERMTSVPEVLYGVGSNYMGQRGARLAKFFAPFPAGA